MVLRRLFLATPLAVVAAAASGGVVVTFMGLYSQDLPPRSAITQIVRLLEVLTVSILVSPVAVFVGALPASLALIVAGPLHWLLSRQGLTHPLWYLLAGAASGLAVGAIIPLFIVPCVIGGAVGGLTFHKFARIDHA